MATYRNFADVHRHHAERIASNVAVRFKREGRWQDLSWADSRNDALACAAALVDAGIQSGDRVGLLGENCVEWMLADLGILTAGAVTVSPHSSLTARQVHFQMEDSGSRWLFVSSAAQLEKMNQVRAELPTLMGVVVLDNTATGDAIAWREFLNRGRQALSRHAAELARRESVVGRDDLATLMYTSGTTGNPKGVMLTHGNLLSNVEACLEAGPLEADDINLCWLPLSHIYARTVDFYERFVAGVPICLAESPEAVVANLKEIQPTHISCVPRFYEKLLAAVGAPDPAVTGARLRAIFGPRIRFCGSGGAPLPAAIEKTLSDAGLPILPGYGLTESSPVITFNLLERYRPHTVGAALPGVEIKIAPDGEVLTRGPHVMAGYWNNPQATAEAIRDGWLYTGDLGSIDADGFLSITGRKKELMVLSSGKKVVPTFIEGLLVADDCIDQAAVYGEGRHFLTALIVPHWENLRKAIKSSARPISDTATDAELACHPAVHELLQKRVAVALADVATWEHVRKFVVLRQPFTVAGGELTVSLKLRRGIVFDKYKAELDALYRD
jgi:long-chain acyl-CoA synthetase